jgi:hypothetical protein
VATLLPSLRAAGAQEQVTELLRRDPAAHVSLDDPYAVVTLLRRDPAGRVALDDPYAVATLLDSLREAGAQHRVTELADRLPGAGLFDLFREQGNRQDRFRFGRQANGSPARPWGWEDLD